MAAGASRLRPFCLPAKKLSHAAAAGRGNDAIHAQVLDQLAVVIHKVRDAEGGHAGAGAVGRGDEGILRGNGVDVGRLLERHAP